MNKIQFEQALRQMRGKYRKDQLSAKIVNYCTQEGILWLFNNYEQNSNKQARIVINWMKEHNDKVPNTTSKVPLEKRYGSWIQNLRKAKKGKGHKIFYPSTEKMFDEAGYHDIFNIKDTIKPEEVINWMKEHNDKKPIASSKDPLEKKYGRWITCQRSNKNGTRDRQFYHSTKKMFDEAGYHDIFNNIDFELRNKEYGKLVLVWMKEHNDKKPITSSKDPLEKKYAIWINIKRIAKKGKGNGGNIFYPSTEKMFTDAGYPDIFNSQDAAPIKPEEVINWMKEHNDKVPRSWSKDTLEAKYGSWINTQRSTKKGKRTYKFDTSTEKMFDEAGYPNIFQPRNL